MRSIQFFFIKGTTAYYRQQVEMVNAGVDYRYNNMSIIVFEPISDILVMHFAINESQRKERTKYCHRIFRDKMKTNLINYTIYTSTMED